MALGWSTRRQLIYYAVGTVVLAVLLTVSYYAFLVETPTCFNGAQDGTERGVDCGGTCALICTQDAKAVTVLWSRSFQTAGNLYTAAAYVQNNNLGAGAKGVSYSFQLYDENNLLIIEKRGVTDLPPIPTIPIVEHNINVGNRTVMRTQFTFRSTPVWNKIPQEDLPRLRVSEQELTAAGTRLETTLTNDSLQGVKNTEVVAVLFDAGGTARAAAKSTVSDLSRRSSQDITFTWPRGNINIVKVDVIVLPSF